MSSSKNTCTSNFRWASNPFKFHPKLQIELLTTLLNSDSPRNEPNSTNLQISKILKLLFSFPLWTQILANIPLDHLQITASETIPNANSPKNQTNFTSLKRKKNPKLFFLRFFYANPYPIQKLCSNQFQTQPQKPQTLTTNFNCFDIGSTCQSSPGSIEALFHYRVVRAYHIGDMNSFPMALEGILITYTLHLFFLILLWVACSSKVARQVL